MSPEAEMIWRMSEEYIPLAAEHLTLTGPYPRLDNSGFEGGTELLRISFIFPGIPESWRGVLLDLAHQRWLLEHPRPKSKHTAGISFLMNLVAATGDDRQPATEPAYEVQQFLHKLRPVQQEVIRAKYLKTEASIV